MTKSKSLVKQMAVILLPFVFSSLVFAENTKIKSIVKADYYNQLITNKEVTLSKDDGSKGFELLPESKYRSLVLENAVEKDSKNVPFTFQGLYVLNKAEILKSSKSSKTDITIDDISVVCRSLTKMEGMTYTKSNGKTAVLYKKCYAIKGENNKTKIADPVNGNADGLVAYCLQDDAEYGVNTYKLTYHQSENEILAQFEILDKMGIGPFDAIFPGKMIISILLVDCGDDVLMFLSTDVDARKYPGIKKIISESMTARMNAVFNWVRTQF